MRTTVFYGNGVNLLSKNGKTWDSILREISGDKMTIMEGTEENIDLWYFLTIRKRLIREKIIERNKIIYYSINDNSLDIGKAKLLEALDVEVDPIPFDWSERAYEKAYDKIYKRIKAEMLSVKGT